MEKKETSVVGSVPGVRGMFSKRAVLLFGLTAVLLFPGVMGCGGPSSARAPEAKSEFRFSGIPAEHKHMRMLLENAFRYVIPGNGTIDETSGYPVEGWNLGADGGGGLRSFTQLTAIGEWIELLADIIAGYADNPHISRKEALERLKVAVKSLRKDQEDPSLSSMGLLSNFLGLSKEGRLGPLVRIVERGKFVEVFGKEKADLIWKALKEKKWIIPQKKDREGLVKRGKEFGGKHFDGPLTPFADDETKDRILAIMGERVAQVIFGDNANLAASMGKAIGALLASRIKNDPDVYALRTEMEHFLEDQREGYLRLYDEKMGMFLFGWNASQDRYFGWELPDGKWVLGYTDYLVNEFRGPAVFVMARYDMPVDPVANLGFKIRSYPMQDGRELYTLAPWQGSAFQALGLGISMMEREDPAWNTILSNFVESAVDHSRRHKLPGFLSESYSGDEETGYSGEIGIPALTVDPNPRITDAPSVYTLGVAYSVLPDKVERFLRENWETLSKLLTDHGPWEGYNTTRNEVIEKQTTAHVLSLLLGALGNASDNMKRYLTSIGAWRRVEAFYRHGEARDLLSDENQALAWAADGSPFELTRGKGALHVKVQRIGAGGFKVIFPGEHGVLLSGGRLTIRYRAEKPIPKVVLRLDRKKGIQRAIPVEIFTRFDATGGEEKVIDVPLPATQGLSGVREAAFLFGNDQDRIPVDLTITGFRFDPYQAASDN